ncbi:MAG: LLM class flavin-dependent oxidoreductase, partial [Deltaproteobacteria bacterium]|nr:LLM class flavin-dependent oxidoreductase [Armatimonadota bacterium]NIO11349.1 LLM class flavin-dependent oxidoreductase [Deltaproteobacteria bacterium]NIO96954.1 LLM class flavin-dependent oxidoreductase [Armatimonadota bacterium]
WVGDSHLIWREAYVNLAAMAVNTSKVKLGTGVSNPITRHPSVVASAFVTLEELASRRINVGIGLGDSSVETMGMKPARLADFEKTIHQMRGLMRGENVELETGSIHLNFPTKEPIPIYIAASGPKMLELAGRVADGVIVLVGTDPSYLKQAQEKIQSGIRAAGRKPEDVELVLWVPCAVSDKMPARDAVKAHVARIVAHP